MTCEIDKLFQCITNDNVETLGSFLEEIKKNITVDDLNKHIVDVEQGRNCLHQIVSQRNPAMLKLFLQTFPDLDLEYPLHGKEGEKTALHLAVSELSETLLSDETDPKKEEIKKEQKTQPNILALLLDYLKTQTKYENCERKFFLEKVVNKTTKEGISVLDHAVQNGLVRETCLLLDMDVFSYREDQEIQMFLLLKRALEYDQPIIAEVLLQHGAIPDFTGEFAHNTLLRTAINNQQWRFAKIFLEHGAGIGEKITETLHRFPYLCEYPFVFGMSIAERLWLPAKNISIFDSPICDQFSLETYENKLRKIRKKLEAITIERSDDIQDFSDSEKKEKNIIHVMNIVMDPEDIKILFNQLRFVFVNKTKLCELSEDDHRALRVLRDLLISLYVEKHAHAEEKEEEKKETEEEINIKKILFKKIIEFGKSNKKIIDIICGPPYERLSSLFQRIIEVNPKERDQLSKYQQYCSARSPVKSLRQLCIDVLGETEFDFSSASDAQRDLFNEQLQGCDPKGDIFKPKHIKNLLLKNQDQIEKIVTALKAAIEEIEGVRKKKDKIVSVNRSIDFKYEESAADHIGLIGGGLCVSIISIVSMGVFIGPHRHRRFLKEGEIQPEHELTGSVSTEKEGSSNTYSVSVSRVIGENTPTPDFSWMTFFLACIGICFFISLCCCISRRISYSRVKREVLKDNEIQEEEWQEESLNLETNIKMLKASLADWVNGNRKQAPHIPLYEELEDFLEKFKETIDFIEIEGALTNGNFVEILSQLELLLDTALEKTQESTSVYEEFQESALTQYQSLCFFKPEGRNSIQEDHVDSDNEISSGKKEIELREIKIDTGDNIFELEEYENISRGVNTSDEQKQSLLQDYKGFN